MPALSYKDRFCKYVQEGSKTQTIRAFRKYPFRVGQQLSHFFGMRTKYCTRLIPGTTPSTDIKTIYILKSGVICIGPYASKREAERNLKTLCKIRRKKLIPADISFLDFAGKNILAWADGFRENDDPTKPNTKCGEMMFQFWKETHQLPFTGQIIYWNKP